MKSIYLTQQGFANAVTDISSIFFIDKINIVLFPIHDVIKTQLLYKMSTYCYIPLGSG